MRVVIAGGRGFLGSMLSAHFTAAGHDVRSLARLPEDYPGISESIVPWDAKTLGGWAGCLQHADVLINLCGKSVDCRYTSANQRAILASRLDSTRILGRAMSTIWKPPRLWINASSATIYRHAEDRAMDEVDGELGEGFSVEVCRQWEDAFFESKVQPGTRRVALRIAIVLGRGGGALVPLRRLTRLGLGGMQGNGNQYVSWLHEADLTGIVDHLINHEELEGIINAAAPKPLPNTEFMKALRKVYRVPFAVPTPAWLLEIGAAIIRTETELILKSRWVVPRRLLDSGYTFQFNEVGAALADLSKHA